MDSSIYYEKIKKLIRKTLYSFLLFFLFFIGSNFSQVYHHGGDFVIRGDIRIEGDLKSYSSFSVDDFVEIKLNGNLNHHSDSSTFIKSNVIEGFPARGTINFTGTQRQYIYSTSYTNLNIIKNSNPIGLSLRKADSTSGNPSFANALIWESIDLSTSNSNILLDSTNIELKYQYNLPDSISTRVNNYGSIKGESNTSLILSDSLEKVFVTGPNASSSTHFPNDYNLGLKINHSNTYNDSLQYSRYGTYIPKVADTSFNRYFVVNKPVELNSPELVYHDNILRSMNEDSLDIYISSNYGKAWRQVGATTNTGTKEITDNNNIEWKPSSGSAPLNQSKITIGKRDCSNPPEVSLSLDSTAVCSGKDVMIEFDSITPSCAVKWYKDGV